MTTETGRDGVQRSGVKTRRRTENRRELARFKRLLRKHLPELEARYGVRSLGVFGSYVHGEAKKRSDLDVLIELGDQRLSLLGFIGLENYLSDLLGFKVDLVEKETLRPIIGQRILAEVEPI
jgi:predicted nucleotidyltransferase